MPNFHSWSPPELPKLVFASVHIFDAGAEADELRKAIPVKRR